MNKLNVVTNYWLYSQINILQQAVNYCAVLDPSNEGKPTSFTGKAQHKRGSKACDVIGRLQLNFSLWF